MSCTRRFRWLLVTILLAGAFLRWSHLGEMVDYLHHDEAYNGVDALSLLAEPRLAPFFPTNYGRESLWHYWLALFILPFGPTPLALRLAATTAGILTIAATYRLGRELLPARAAVWSAAALAVLYWHVHLSHLVFRALLMPLIGALAFTALLRARRTNDWRLWLLGGAGVGALAYTYFAARAWILLAFLFWLWWAWQERGKWRIKWPGMAAAGLATILIAAPLVIYMNQHPVEASERINTVAISTLDEAVENGRLWARAWFHEGDQNATLNIPGRPILDLYLAVLFIAGLIYTPLAVNRQRLAWIVGLAFFGMLPSLLSDYAPHFLRAIGLTLPLAFILGSGAWFGERLGRRIIQRRSRLQILPSLLPLALLLLAGAGTARDWRTQWLYHDDTYRSMEWHINEAARFIHTHSDAAERQFVYFSPFNPYHPNIAYLAAGLRPGHVGAFSSQECLVVPPEEGWYVSLTLYEPAFEQLIAPWVDAVERRRGYTASGNLYWYTVFQGRARSELLDWTTAGAVQFDGKIQAKPVSSIATRAQPGDALSFYLGLQSLESLDRPYSVFVHLHGDPTPYDGGILWAQADRQLCVSYPPPAWQPGETIIQPFDLFLPADLPAGDYAIAIGLYESPAGARLPITWPAGAAQDYFIVSNLAIEE